MWLKSFLRWMAVSGGAKLHGHIFWHASHSKSARIAGWFELENRPCIVPVPTYDSRFLFEDPVLPQAAPPGTLPWGSLAMRGDSMCFSPNHHKIVKPLPPTKLTLLLEKNAALEFNPDWNISSKELKLCEHAFFCRVLNMQLGHQQPNSNDQMRIELLWSAYDFNYLWETVWWWPDLAVHTLQYKDRFETALNSFK